MKNLFLLFVQLGFVFFLIATITTIVNCMTGWKMNIKGTPIPTNFSFAFTFLAVAFVCGAISFLIARKS
ncbi:MAG TPA: hypothetical protein PKY59_02130 [Pyrinomonadaceae bacterium]|nr:hypothetical protein [Pyrinomonadaceae bacterium]